MEQEKVVYIDKRKQIDDLVCELHAVNGYLSYHRPLILEAEKRRKQLNKILDQWLEEDAAEAAAVK